MPYSDAQKHLFRLSEHLQVLESSRQPLGQQQQQQQHQNLHSLDLPLVQQPFYTQAQPQGKPDPAASPALPAAARGLLIEACLVGRLYKLSSIHHPDIVSKQMVRHLETGAEVRKGG